MSDRGCLVNLDHLLRDSSQGPPHDAACSPAQFFARLGDVRPVLFTRDTSTAIEDHLSRAGIAAARFAAIVADFDPDAHTPMALATRHFSATDTPPAIVFVVSAEERDMRWAGSDDGSAACVVPLLLAAPADDGAIWDTDQAWFVARDLEEAAALITAPRRSESLSVVLMAYNESATIARAIREVRRFCRLYLGDGEIIVVDDGSTDDTYERALELTGADLRVLRHPSNQGMGASMRDGYLAARNTYITSLPADRQVRAQSLAPFLAHLDPLTCVHSLYTAPHSGARRKAISSAFSLLREHVGGLTVDFAGAYIIHRDWRAQIDLARLPSDSFVFSFELLQALKERGCTFRSVPMRAFPRTAGASRVARPGRILKVAAELLYSRLIRESRRLRGT